MKWSWINGNIYVSCQLAIGVAMNLNKLVVLEDNVL